MSDQHPHTQHPMNNDSAPPGSHSAQQMPRNPDRIGDILRRVREHLGEDLHSISERLRIKEDFLIALENSRYDKLPADAYVIGFLRSYANYLGLDGRGAIDQYRREMAGRRRKPQLTMPQPMPEGRAPSAIMLAGAAFAALLVYGIWYGLSTPDRPPEEKEILLPETVVEAQTSPSNEALSLEPGSIVLQTASPPEIPVNATLSNAQPAATPATQTSVAPPVENKSKAETAPSAPETDSTSTKATPAKKEEKTEPAALAKPLTFGAQKNTRVKIRADKDSWVMVTDSKGVTIFDRTLKAGESYNVPIGKSLNMTTGSPSNITMLVDGSEMPKLPTLDRVVRDVPLDPAKLKPYLAPSPQPEEIPAETDENTAAD